jgi:hypothetical protein
VLEVLASVIRQEKEIKHMKTAKEEINLFLIVNYVIFCIENSKQPTQNFQNFIKIRIEDQLQKSKFTIQYP